MYQVSCFSIKRSDKANKTGSSFYLSSFSALIGMKRPHFGAFFAKGLSTTPVELRGIVRDDWQKIGLRRNHMAVLKSTPTSLEIRFARQNFMKMQGEND